MTAQLMGGAIGRRLRLLWHLARLEFVRTGRLKQLDPLPQPRLINPERPYRRFSLRLVRRRINSLSDACVK